LGLTTLPPSCADRHEIWDSLNLLQPSGPVQATNGIPLPFTFATVQNILSGRAGTWNLCIDGFQIVCSQTYSHYKQQGLTTIFIGLFTSISFNDHAIITLIMKLCISRQSNRAVVANLITPC
jgi:ABC-type uncharacterized transport system permease subunit